MKEVILHIGTHKTGTSSIQHTLVGFDDGKTIYSKIGANHSKAVTTLFHPNLKNYGNLRKEGASIAEIESRQQKCLNVLEAEIARSSRDRLIISGEDISVLPVEGKKKLLQFFHDRQLVTKILCYVREPSSMAKSVHQQRIKGGARDLSIYETDYKKRLAPFLDFVPHQDIKVKEFRRDLLKQSDVVLDFAQEVGIDISVTSIITTNESLSAATVKLLLLFNRLPVKSTGTAALVEARKRFVELLERAYQKHKRLDGKAFSESFVCSKQEADFLRDNFGIEFEPCEGDAGNSKLERYLTDLSDVDLEPLNVLLDKHELSAKVHDTVESKLIALFYAVLHGHRLIDGDAELLRDIAMKYETAECLGLEEAEYLMELALRARPDGPVIARKLKEYREKQSKDHRLFDKFGLFKSARPTGRN